MGTERVQTELKIAINGVSWWSYTGRFSLDFSSLLFRGQKN